MIKAVFKEQIEGSDRITPAIVGTKAKVNKILRRCEISKLCANIRYHRLNYRNKNKKLA